MQKNRNTLILLMFVGTIITLSILNLNTFNRLNKYREGISTEEKLIIKKINKKELLEIEIGSQELNSEVELVNNEKLKLNLETIKAPSLIFYFNNEGCKSCNATYIENEFKRVKKLSGRYENFRIIILSNFKDFREFYSHSLKFTKNMKIKCYNINGYLFAKEATVQPDLCYFILNNNYCFNSVFLPDYIFEHNNDKYFNLVLKKLHQL